MKKAIIFDFDGTIGDTLPLVSNLVFSTLEKKRPKEFTLTQIRELVRSFTTQELLEEFELSRFNFMLQVISLRRNMKREIITCSPHVGIKSLLLELRSLGYKLYIVSSNSSSVISPFLKKYDLNFFDGILGKASHFSKEHSLKKLSKSYCLSPEVCVYVGDEVRDFSACKKIFMDSIIVDFGFNSRTLLEKYDVKEIISSYDDFLFTLNKISKT